MTGLKFQRAQERTGEKEKRVLGQREWGPATWERVIPREWYAPRVQGRTFSASNFDLFLRQPAATRSGNITILRTLNGLTRWNSRK